jgi:hypothetical protein
LFFDLIKQKARSVTFYKLTLDNNNTIVQYLFKPVSLIILISLFSRLVSSNIEWEKKLCATVNRMLRGVFLGVHMVLIIKTPFFSNKYAGEYLNIVNVLWKNCFL